MPIKRPGSESVLCALVVMDSAEPCSPREVVAVFHVPVEADEFAGRQGFADYTVVPLRFVTDFR